MLASPAGNLLKNEQGIAEMKALLTEREREQERLRRRMDRFDSIVHEYLRSNHRTVEDLAEKIGCDPSSLWRYRKKVEYFRKAPLESVCICLRLANVSNENLRYILGLPTGKTADEN